MNVLDVLDVARNEVPPLTRAGVTALLSMRRASFAGFAAIEQRNRGIITPNLALSSAQGQEAARVLLLRVLEEMMKSHGSSDPHHTKEELIDALNYLWSLSCFADVPPTRAISAISAGLEDAGWGNPASTRDLNILLGYMDPFLQKLRNRTWQRSPQSLYFDGIFELERLLDYGTSFIAMGFPNYDVFATYFIAKDHVLQFRLRTGY